MRLLFFIVIMGLHSGGLFAQVASPIYSITREAMQIYATLDSMMHPFAQIDTINCCPAYVIRPAIGNWADQRSYQGQLLYFNKAEQGPQLQPVAPIPTVEFNTNAIPLKLGLMFISGAADGMTQVIAFHPDRFFDHHPGADRQFWDNSISWRNKYRNGDPEQGRAFIGSTTWLAWTTDAYHLFRTTSRLTAVAGLTIPLYKGSGKKLKHYAAEIGLSGLAWSAGFHTSYSLIYK